ncbi:MAG: Flp pilus assembly protein CpaB [Kiritimatiellae bacterium]|nr:Flp pilus assembly protein CpaB [Kiritimatiellia bacterium]
MQQKIVLIVSIVVGLLAAFLTRTYLATKDAEVQKLKADFAKRHGTVVVLCFKRDVPSGTVLTFDDIEKRIAPKAGLRGQALTGDELDIVLGRKILNGHSKGEVLFWADLEGGHPNAGGLAADIRKKMRAVSINCSGAAAVSGMVKPNDHVDVIATFSFPKLGEDKRTMVQETVTCTILQNVLVLATGKETSKSSVVRNDLSGAGAYSMVTLEVTPREAEMLVFAEQIRGRITLALRNRNDTYYEAELPQVDFEKIRSEIEDLNRKRQNEVVGGR